MTDDTANGPPGKAGPSVAASPAFDAAAFRDCRPRLSWLVLGAAFVAMALTTWGAWPDPLIDFGAEPYTAWLLAQGQVLGRDLGWAHTGPLTPYLLALQFKLLGPGLRGLFAVNLLILAAATWLLVESLAAVAGRVAATGAGLVFLLVFAFSQYTGIANYNWVAPYTHGATHGMLAVLAAVSLVSRWAVDRRRWRLLATGAALGLAFLTKPEVFVAGAAGVGAVWLLGRGRERGIAREALAIAAPAALVVAVAWASLVPATSPGEAWHITARPWLLLGSAVPRSAFYLELTGLDDPRARAAAVLRSAGWWAAAGVAAAAFDRLAARLRLPPPAALGTGMVLGAAAAFVLVPPASWPAAAPALPLLVGAIGGACILRLQRSNASPSTRVEAVTGAGLAVLAMGLLGKVLLHVRFDHYGFFLAAVGTMLVAAWAFGPLPSFLRRAGGSGHAFRGVAAGLFFVGTLAMIRTNAMVVERKVVDVGEGADRFRSDPRGLFVNAALDAIAKSPPGETLAVLPEGVFVNYLARRVNPTPYVNVLPVTINAVGEPAIVSAYRQSPPDLILLVHRDAAEHGARFFGRDYAATLAAWIRENYQPVARAGAEPFQATTGFGMVLLRRRSPLGEAP